MRRSMAPAAPPGKPRCCLRAGEWQHAQSCRRCRPAVLPFLPAVCWRCGSWNRESASSSRARRRENQCRWGGRRSSKNTQIRVFFLGRSTINKAHFRSGTPEEVLVQAALHILAPRAPPLLLRLSDPVPRTPLRLVRESQRSLPIEHHIVYGVLDTCDKCRVSPPPKVPRASLYPVSE